MIELQRSVAQLIADFQPLYALIRAPWTDETTPVERSEGTGVFEHSPAGVLVKISVVTGQWQIFTSPEAGYQTLAASGQDFRCLTGSLAALGV